MEHIRGIALGCGGPLNDTVGSQYHESLNDDINKQLLVLPFLFITLRSPVIYGRPQSVEKCNIRSK